MSAAAKSAESPPPAKAAPAVEKGVSAWAVAWRQLRRNRVAMFAAWSLGLLAMVALLSPLLANSKPLICSYEGRLLFPAVRDYLDENIPWPFALAKRLTRWKPDWFSPSYAHVPELHKGGGWAIPDWRRIKREIDADPKSKNWYLSAPVPYYYKDTSSAGKQLPCSAVLHLEVVEGAGIGEHLELAPTIPWSQLLPGARPEHGLGAVVVAWEKEGKGRWVVRRAEDAPPDVVVQLRPAAGSRATAPAAVEVTSKAPTPLRRGDVLAIGPARLEVAFPPLHLLGTDKVGRDVLSRVIHGTVIACSVGFVSVGIYVFIGIVLGSLAGYFRGWVDIAISRLIEIVICFPTLFLIISIVALWEEPSIYNVMIALGLTGWTGVARLVRGEFLKAMSEDYVQAARALGFDHGRIIFRHILPNAIAPVFVSASFGVAGAILVESSLSFLGFGVAPPTASWGEIMKQGRETIQENLWHLVWVPGFCIFYTVTMFNLLGEGLRDALDPKLRQ